MNNYKLHQIILATEREMHVYMYVHGSCTHFFSELVFLGQLLNIINGVKVFN
jgi:hypothetical protein